MVGAGDFAPPWEFGWCSFDLNIPGDAFPGDVDFPSNGGDTSQSYVMAVSSATGSLRGRPGGTADGARNVTIPTPS